MAAKTDSGIIFNSVGIKITEISNRKPWIIAESLVLPLDCMLAELRTITCVIGKPPIKPDTILPAPCASNSLLVGVTFLWGSNLSVASTQSKVSKLATKAIVKAVTQTCGFVMALKLGKLNWPMHL